MLKKDLLHRYKKGRANAMERQIVEEWYAQYSEDEVQLEDSELERRILGLDSRIKNIAQEKPKTRPLWGYWVAAAAVVMLIGMIAYYSKQHSFPLFSEQTDLLTDVQAPVGERTTVILQNNEKISLDAIRRGDTVLADGYSISRLETGEIKYTVLENSSPQVFNTIETGVGGGTTLILSDGTKVWLNSKSKVTYPAVFASDIREVQLEGEAYFEVVSSNELADNPPFYVKSKAHTLRVYGTKFNIKTYKDNYMATLMEGKIGLMKESSELGQYSEYHDDVILTPNQQYAENARIKVRTLNEPLRVLDWKDGYFYLTGQSMADLSEKLSMWYGVSFVMEEAAGKQVFFGQVSRDKNLSAVLGLMEEVSALSFRIEKTTVFVEYKN